MDFGYNYIANYTIPEEPILIDQAILFRKNKVVEISFDNIWNIATNEE